ncbi:hypothetical protein [Nafulsella turpanensis]|uniref:hypothetical protein n=1 Tax=Nafulsella turpanensis TaxID=1265690 RepID=UPI0003457220|nr:hypothetical protein [Nafulsella turpanensis]
MKGNKLFYGIAIAVALLLGYFFWATFSQPGVQDLKGDYERVAFYKNENNTGPVQRKYAITTSDTLWLEMEQYGEYMPHTKYGRTVVYFFSESAPVPTELQPGEESLAPEYHPYVLARYEKNHMGKVSFIKYPYQ